MENTNNNNLAMEKARCMRRKNCKCHFGEDDIIIQDFRLNAVHEFPQKTAKGWEITFGTHKYKLKNLELDFYMDTGKDIYLLRLQDIAENMIFFIHRETITNEILPMTYIIVRKKISENIREELNEIIKKLIESDFPEYDEERTYEIKEWN